MNIVYFNGESYPEWQTQGFAAQFAFPFAQKVCKGKGYDIGCNRKEWALPGSIPIDLGFEDQYQANCLPSEKVDYIFSSHCLEHVPHWVNTLDYWISKVKKGGHIFLYLPHKDQQYWRPWNCIKHIHMFEPMDIVNFFKDRGHKKIFWSERDLNHSFMVVVEIC